MQLTQAQYNNFMKGYHQAVKDGLKIGKLFCDTFNIDDSILEAELRDGVAITRIRRYYVDEDNWGVIRSDDISR